MNFGTVAGAIALIVAGSSADARTMQFHTIAIDYIETRTHAVVGNTYPMDDHFESTTTTLTGRFTMSGNFVVDDDGRWSTENGESYETSDSFGGVGGFSFLSGGGHSLQGGLSSGTYHRSLVVEGKKGAFEFEDDDHPTHNEITSTLEILSFSAPGYDVTYSTPVVVTPLPAGGILILSALGLTAALRRRVA